MERKDAGHRRRGLEDKDRVMNSCRRMAILSGILLVSGIVFGLLNTVPALEFPGYLEKLPTIRTQVLIAVFFQAAMATAYVCIAALFYPLIKKSGEGLAMGYFGFRIIGAAFLFVGIGSLLLLLWLSQNYVEAGQLDSSYFIRVGELLRTGRDIMNHIGMVLPWCSGGLILYYCMFKLELVPKWLSIWGIASSALSILATLMLMLGFIKIISAPYMLMNVPTGLHELSLATFLIVKGFNPSKLG